MAKCGGMPLIDKVSKSYANSLPDTSLSIGSTVEEASFTYITTKGYSLFTYYIYSTVLLYIGILKVWGFLPKFSPTNQPNINVGRFSYDTLVDL